MIESGKVTQDDLATLKSMTRLTNLEMNLDGDLELIGAEGTATTVLPAELFIKSNLETVSLAGFTEIGESAFKDTKISGKCNHSECDSDWSRSICKYSET